MTITPHAPGLAHALAAEIFAALPAVGEDMAGRPHNGDAALVFFPALLESKTPEEAITFGSYLLPPRKGVWWAHQCVSGLLHLLGEDDRHMLQLAEDWVRQPEEGQRVAALTGAMTARTKTPGVWVALAAGWTSGSMVGPDLPAVPPPAYLTPRAVNAAILSGLARVDLLHRAQTLKAFVDMGLNLAVQ
ncbi:hypothetical protein DMC47_08810 [Nostoc sp. 3335mG]|nr:hypothetical protein DMC47_08810 [Nostoc sp. 3335mG]